MSFRPGVDRSRIDHFLRELGRAFRYPARLYLVGGTTLVYERLRGATLDIDFAVEVDATYHGDFMRQLARLKDQLSVNVEEASPADFIPLPTGWQARARYLGRFGRIEVFHFDPVSTALSKFARGHEQDLADIRALLQAGFIAPDDIRHALADIVPRLPEYGWSATEIADLKANVAQVLTQENNTAKDPDR